MELISSLALAQTPPTTPITKPAAPARDPNTIGIVAGGPEEGSLRLVNEIARGVAGGQETGPNGELALRVLPFVGRGGIHDVRDVLSLPGVDMAITQEHLLTRLQESKELGDLKSKLVYVAKLFNEELMSLRGRTSDKFPISPASPSISGSTAAALKTLPAMSSGRLASRSRRFAWHRMRRWKRCGKGELLRLLS
jgi:hypothetical protein